jgi:hypothetical protein
VLHVRPKIFQPLIFVDANLKKAGEYSCAIRAFQPMMLAIPLEGTIVTLCQLHPLPLDLVPPPIFDYQPKHIIILDRILFAQALTIAPHLSLGGLSKMVYECLLGCFILKDPS